MEGSWGGNKNCGLDFVAECHVEGAAKRKTAHMSDKADLRNLLHIP